MTTTAASGSGPEAASFSRPTASPTFAEARGTVTFGRLLRYFAWLGATGFGGPVATVGYMQRDLVEDRAWLDRDEFLDGIALGQTMPGPLAAQVTMWVGYLQRGALGALGTAAAFVLPSFVLVLALAFLYRRFESLHVVSAVFYGVAPAAIAIIVLAAVKLARMTDGRDPRLWIISLVTLVATVLTGAEIAVLVVGSGLLMVVLEGHLGAVRRVSSLFGTVPLPGAGLVIAGLGGTLPSLFLYFLVTGAIVFGSGLAIVPVLREGVVVQHHWLSSGEFLDAVAIGLITPGPVVISAAFIGYLVAGVPGAVVASVGIFLPIYVGVVIPGRWFVRHRHHPVVRSFVMGATAAAAGTIGGATILLARQAIVDLPTVLIAGASLVLLSRLRFRFKEPAAIFLAAAVGIALRIA